MYVSSIHRSNFFTTVLCYWGSCKIRSRHPWVPGDHVRSKQEKFLKVLNGYELTIQATPHMALFASFEKSQFAEVSETLRRGPQGPGQVKMEFSQKILDGLEQTLQTTPHMAPFASFEKSRFWKVPGDPSAGSLGTR